MNREWLNFCEEMDPNPVSGARITKLGPVTMLYNERPMCSPDGKRMLVVHGGNYHVLDLETGSFTLVHENPEGNPCCTANSAFSDYVYFWKAPGEKEDDVHEVYRVSLSSLAHEHVASFENPTKSMCAEYEGKKRRPCPWINNLQGSASPNDDYIVYGITAPNTCRLVRADLATGRCEVIHEDPEIVNPHLQVEPVWGRDIMVQHNRGAKVDQNGNVTVRCAAPGATHYFIDSDGGNLRKLAVGEPYCAPSSGHSAWIVGQIRMAVAIGWVHNPQDRFDPDKPPDWTTDRRYPGASLVTVGADDTRPVPFVTPEHRFFHVSVSRCGRYFIANSGNRRGPTCIVVGNLLTGKYATIVGKIFCRAGPTAIAPCSLPFFTSDNRYVIYRAKHNPELPAYAGYSMYAAEIPAGFLEGLA